MNKQEFLTQLRKGLSVLHESDVEEQLTFYSEMIDDRTEEGLSEEEAVREIGNVHELVSQILSDTPFSKLLKEKITTKRKIKAWEVILLVLGSPIWLSLLIALIAVTLSLYVVLWSLIISLWSVFGTLAGCLIGSIVAGIVLTCTGNAPTGMAMLSVGFICAGIGIFMFYGCKAVTKGLFILTKKFALGIRTILYNKEETL